MKGLTRVAVVVSVVLCGGLCFAEGGSNDRLVDLLMQRSGLKKQIEQLPQVLQTEIDRSRKEPHGLSQQEFNRVARLAKSAVDAKAIHASVRTSMERNLSEKDMRAVLEWLESPLGRKITKLEEEASTGAAYAEMQAMAPQLLKDNMGTSRFFKMAKLDRTTRCTETMVDMALNIQLTMLTAMAATMGANVRPSFEEIRHTVSTTKMQVQEEMAGFVQVMLLYTYRGLTEYEIDRYIEFAASRSGQRYHQVALKALSDAAVQASRRMGSQIGVKMRRI